MKSTLHLLVVVFLCTTLSTVHTTDPINDDNDKLNTSGYLFDVNVTKINSEFSEIPSAVFRNKLVLVSSKKIGAIGNGKDKYTRQPYSNLFCTDINKADIELSQPIFFSRILNSKGNDGQLSFTPDETTVYYTQSTRDNSANYQLYTAELKPNSYGKWINQHKLGISSDDYSIENPHVSEDGKFLYFSSNMEGGFGGFDIYKALIKPYGLLGEPINLGRNINTEKDEKYPHTARNGNELFFSSKGHNSQGGFDIFISNNHRNLNYTKPRNLGVKINSIRDDIAFVLIDEDRGVYSSNAGNRGQRYNMYKFNARAIYQNLEGIVVENNGEKISDAIVILYDSSGTEIGRQITGRDATYSFKIRPFEGYHLKTVKDGYEDAMVEFQSQNVNTDVAYNEVLKLSTKG
ncbi:MAG: hypothetical protein HKN40_09810 [Winogradskyella sp.]|uniref:TolB family protein n=1 Tax=Winogradskyella sp. TaxID=1883156 RepID=UPI001853CAF9|nr:hypothetical protein [Winogradskyella sp.]